MWFSFGNVAKSKLLYCVIDKKKIRIKGCKGYFQGIALELNCKVRCRGSFFNLS